MMIIAASKFQLTDIVLMGIILIGIIGCVWPRGPDPTDACLARARVWLLRGFDARVPSFFAGAHVFAAVHEGELHLLPRVRDVRQLSRLLVGHVPVVLLAEDLTLHPSVRAVVDHVAVGCAPVSGVFFFAKKPGEECLVDLGGRGGLLFLFTKIKTKLF